MTQIKPGSTIRFRWGLPGNLRDLTGEVNRVENHPERGITYWTRVGTGMYPVHSDQIR